MRNRVSDDMINVMLRQMGAASIKTTPAHINVAKFLIGDDLRLTYMYEVKEEEIYLQRISPYPMMIGKIYNCLLYTSRTDRNQDSLHADCHQRAERAEIHEHGGNLR